MNVLEIDESISDIQKALGFSVQNVYYYDKTLVLSLWQNHASHWLVISLRYDQQSIFIVPEQKIKLKNEKKPIQIFALAHLKHLYFTDIRRVEIEGRKIQIHFSSSDSEDVMVEVVLVPTVLNISIFKGKKQVHLNKPKDLPEFKSNEQANLKLKPLEDVKNNWLQSLQKKSIDGPDQGRKTLKSEIEKKQKALKKVESDLDKKMNEDYYQFALLLETNAVEAKDKFPDLFDSKKSIHKLKDEYFEKQKSLKQKILRSEDRVLLLKNELKDLCALTESDWSQILKSNAKGQSQSFNQKSEIKVRKLEIANDLVAYYGKSAADNLKLLRSAKAWHYWIHIKDMPSSHMIIFRDKNRDLKDGEVQKAIVWFLNEAHGVSKDNSAEAFDVLMTECRYVRPIKGDKLGRVNYSHEKVLRVKS